MARRFVFKLQPVLEQRERAEEEQQLRVAAIERERVAIESRVRECQTRIIESREELRRELGGPDSMRNADVRVDEVRFQANASLHLVAKARQAVLELAGVYRRLETARAELGRVTAARKAVQMLKDKQHIEWKQTLARREALELDEMTVMRHAREDSSL